MQFTIRRALLLSLTGLVALITVLLVGFSLNAGSNLSSQLATPLVEHQASRAHQALELLVDPIRTELAESVRLIHSGLTPPRDPDSLRQRFLHGFQELDGVESMMIGDEAGYQFLIMRYGELVTASPLLHGVADVPPLLPEERRFFTREFRPDEWGERSLWTVWDDSGTQMLASWEIDMPGYDPRERPWLKNALERLREVEAGDGAATFEELLVWTDVYTMYTSKTPGISASVAARDPKGRPIVVAYDLLLEELTKVTMGARPTDNGRVFMLDERGRTVALLGGAGLGTGEESAATLLRPIDELEYGGLAGWIEAWSARPDDAPEFFSYTDGGERWWGHREAYELGIGQRLWIGVAVPHSDVLEISGNDPNQLLAVATLGFTAALILGMWLARRFSAPLAALVEESLRIGRLDLTPSTSATASSLTELRTLATALGTMRSALHDHVSAREKGLAALAASESRFRSTFEQAAVGLLHVAPDGRVLLVNQRMCNFLGYTRDELLHKRFADFTHPDERERDLERLKSFLAGEILTSQWEKRYIHRNGQILWSEITVGLHRDESGEPLFFVSVVQDINERKQLESDLLQSQKLEAVGRLAGGVAHDFNNLLTVISGYSQIARSALPKDHPAHQDIGQVERAAASAAALTSQLLSFARREIRSPRVIDLAAHLCEVANLIKRLIGEDIELVLPIQGGPHHVLIDPTQFQQVLMNLAVNARDAMPDGGTLTIALDDADWDHAEILVSDTGHGMTPEIRAHAFEPFFTTKDVGRGTGLGLATCYGIVEQAGGRIQIDSEDWKGTTISIHLPRTSAEPMPDSVEVRVSGEAQPGTILLVEDEAEIRALSERVLRDEGFRVIVAANGIEALELFEQEQEIDLVVTDVVMPGMNGGELASQLRRLRPQQRVLFVSGYAQTALAGKIPDHISLLAKPYSPDALLDRIRKSLATDAAPHL